MLDNCPTVANADQRDSDGNGLGDACECADMGGSPSVQSILKLQYRNGAVAPLDNQIKPQFQLTNTGPVDIALKDVTVRYWYSNGNTRAQQFWVDYAQLGNANVTGRFVRPYMLHAGGNSYLEVGFTAAAGVIHPGQGSGEVQTRFNAVDWSNYNETDDYSYSGSLTTYADWNRITVYVGGLPVWGKEPLAAYCSGGPFTLGQAFHVEYQVGDPGLRSDNHVKPHLQVFNDGAVDVPLAELTLRYWYTADGMGDEQTVLDYAALGAQNVKLRVVRLDAARPGADRYLEVSFPAKAGSLLAGANTGGIFTRFHKVDWSNYNEANDYSYNGAQTSFAPTTKVTLYRNGALVAGAEP